jgi:hypothetical protein
MLAVTIRLRTPAKRLQPVVLPLDLDRVQPDPTVLIRECELPRSRRVREQERSARSSDIRRGVDVART